MFQNKSLFHPSLSTPAVPLDLQEVESKVEGFKTFTKRMDENIVVVNATINEFARKQATGFKKEYQKVGQSFKLLAQAFELDQQAYSAGLNKAIADTGEAYEAIGEYFAEQPRQDLDPISDLLDLYRGHLDNFPDIIHVQKGAEVCVQSCLPNDILLFGWCANFDTGSVFPNLSCLVLTASGNHHFFFAFYHFFNDELQIVKTAGDIFSCINQNHITTLMPD